MVLLKNLSEAYAPSGCEMRINSLIADEIREYTDEIYTDVMGNLIAHKKGSGKKIMYLAHTDEIGFAVISIDDKGFIRFGVVGNVNEKLLPYRTVIFKNGTIGIIAIEKTSKEVKDISTADMYIDIGAIDKNDAEKKVSVGDVAVFENKFCDLGDILLGKTLGSRSCVWMLTEAIKGVCDNENDLYFVFSSQKEVGNRGAKTAAFSIKPDYAIVLDLSEASDIPSDTENLSFGKGVAIRVMDKSFIADNTLKNAIISAADKNGIKYQIDVSDERVGSAGAVQLACEGIKTAVIAICTRYAYTPREMVCKSDIFEALKLLKTKIL